MTASPRPPPEMDIAVATPAAAAPTAAPARFGQAHASDDARLVERAGAGDETAFARLYERYARMVHGILLARVGIADAEDLVQDVFFTAWHRLHALRDPAAFGGWLATIARNRATDYFRQTREQVELPDEIPGGEAIEDETMAVLDVIRKLPEAYRETLLMRLVEGMTGAEIAARSGLTPASVRVNLHRGMKLLREKLAPWSDNGRAAVRVDHE
jgi:RNA polymerase sigma-70 factor, ECF subfamily